MLAFTRRPFRKDLAWLALALPLGVVAQAVLGGFTVREDLAPGFVMSHFLLSMVILIFAVWLAWRATYRAGRAAAQRRPRCWSGRSAALPVLCALTLVAGTAATAAGPALGRQRRPAHQAPDDQGPGHARVGGPPARDDRGDLRRARRSSSGCSSASAAGELDPLEPLTVLGILLAAQGLVGAVQYELKLPGQMVWVHVVLATLTWLVSLWAVAVEGRIGKTDRTGSRTSQSLRSWRNGHRAFQRAEPSRATRTPPR